MARKRNILVALILVTMMVIATVAYANFEDLQFFKAKKGIPMDGYVINMSANGQKLFSTTAGDYYANKEYYNKKFGLGKYWRENHSPIEPKDIKYTPHSSAVKKGFPIIHIKN